MSAIILFEEKQVRRAWNEDEKKWYFSVVDVIAVLTGSVDPGAYWRKLKERLKHEGNQTVTNCHGLKMTAADGKQRLTDAEKRKTPVAFLPIKKRPVRVAPWPETPVANSKWPAVKVSLLEEISNNSLLPGRSR